MSFGTILCVFNYLEIDGDNEVLHNLLIDFCTTYLLLRDYLLMYYSLIFHVFIYLLIQVFH